jgi:hypothetical protein
LCRTVLSYTWRYGVQRRGVDGRSDESRPHRVSWRALYLPKSGFEGGCVGASRLVVVRTLIRGTTDERPADAQ